MASGDKFYIADKVTLDEVNNKIGNMNDTGGTTEAGTVFAKLNDVVFKNGRIADKNGGFLTAISNLKGAFLQEVGRTLSMEGAIKPPLEIDETFLYYADATTFKVYKFNKATLEKVGETPVQEGYANTLAIDNNYIYYMDYTAKKIIRFDKASMTKLNESAVQDTGALHSMKVDSTSLYMFSYVAKKVCRFDKVTLEKTGETTAQSISTYVIDIDDSYIYCPLSATSGSYFVVFDKNTLSVVKEINAMKILGIIVDSNYIYGVSSNATGILKIDKTTFSVVASVWFPDAFFSSYLAMDSDHIYAADVSTKTSTNEVFKINKDTVTKVAQTTENFGGRAYGLAVDEECLYHTDDLIKVIKKYNKNAVSNIYEITGFVKE